MSVTPRVKLDTTYCIKDKNDRHIIHKVGCIKDLGVSDISVSKINSVSITVLRIIDSFKFLLYFYFGKLFRFSFSFQIIFISVSISVFISISGFIMLKTKL